MRRFALATVAAVALVSPLAGQAPQTTAPAARLEFDVASIKRNTSDQFPGGPTPLPSLGELNLRRIQARFLATRAFPGLTTPLQVLGLPDWADSERYDVVVTFRPGATAEEQAEMWRNLLADRMKLAAHVETRPRPAYKLVLARTDRRLGPQLKPSTLNCPDPDSAARPPVPPEVSAAMLATLRERRLATPQEETLLLSHCFGTFNAWNTLYGGAVDIKALPGMLSFFGRLDRPVVDETGLQGRFSLKLWAAPPAVAAATAPSSAASPALDDAPSFFSALQDQLGLKLEPTTIEGKVLVVDHIERPTEN